MNSIFEAFVALFRIQTLMALSGAWLPDWSAFSKDCCIQNTFFAMKELAETE